MGFSNRRNQRVFITAVFLLTALLMVPAALFAADTIPPTGTIAISKDNPYTKTTSVTLKLSARDTGSGVYQMTLSNDNSTWSTPEKYTTSKKWTLSSGDGPKTVYVKFSDKAGNWSMAYSDSITLDTKGPTITVTSPTEGEVIR